MQHVLVHLDLSNMWWLWIKYAKTRVLGFWQDTAFHKKISMTYVVQYITATRDTSLEFDFTSCFISKFFINLFHELCELFFKRRDAAVSQNRIPVPKIRFLCLLIFFCFSIISIIAFCQSLEAGGYMKQPVACSAEYRPFLIFVIRPVISGIW